MQVDPGLPAQTVRQWSLRLNIPYGQIRAAINKGTLTYYRFTPRGAQYITAEDMQDFLDRSRFNADPGWDDPEAMTMDIPSAE